MSDQGQKKIRRRKMRNFLLQPLVQVRLGIYSILLASLFSMAVLGILYTNLIDFADIVITLTDSESEVREMFRSYMEQIQWWVLAVVMGFLFTNIAVSVIYTHRLVGPTVAFRHQIQRLIDGNFSGRVRLRKGDAFQEVAEDLNRLADILQRNNGKINIDGPSQAQRRG